MDLPVDEFKKRFPKLAQEMEHSKGNRRTPSLQSEANEGRDPLRGYIPGAIDFLRRCDNAEEGGVIIDYLEKRGEISPDHAMQLRHQLRKKGLRSFGSKKEDGHYLRRGLR